jgi:hypothetical protein
VDEIYKHTQSTKQGKIIITIRIIIIVIIVIIIIIILEVEGGSSRSHSLENSVWKRLLTCRETDKYLNNNNNILLVSITEELLGRNSSGSGQENREYDRGDSLR